VFDLVVHNHVLEHLCCDILPVIAETVRTIRPGGYMFFSVPFREGKLDDGWKETLTDDEKISRFDQADHVRIFGTEDFSQYEQTVYEKHQKIAELEIITQLNNFLSSSCS